MTITHRHQLTYSAVQIEDELCKARAKLARLQKRQESSTEQQHHNQIMQQQQNSYGQLESATEGTTNDDCNENSGGTEMMELFLRAQKLQDRIEILRLNRSMISSTPQLPSILSASETSTTSSSSSVLYAATKLCTKLGLILLQQQDQQHQLNRSQPHPYHEAILDWYHSLHKSSRTMASTVFRRELRKHAPEFPSTELSSRVVANALLGGLQSSVLPTATTKTKMAGDGGGTNGGDANANNIMEGFSYAEWNLASQSLVELQVIHDALTLEQEKHSQLRTSSSIRLDILDELCRPLAERVQFHFLDERSGGLMSKTSNASMTSPGEVKKNEDEMAHQYQQLSNFERLPEWLFQYLREVVQNHGVYSLVVLKGVQSLVNTVVESLIVCATAATKVETAEEEGNVMRYSSIAPLENGEYGTLHSTSDKEMIRNLKRQYYDHAPTYFLREVARMARHVLRAKSFFHHPGVVGSACRDRAVVLRGIEQLFLFDEFVVDTLKVDRGGRVYNVNVDSEDGMKIDAKYGGGYDYSSSIYLPPKMVDTFLSNENFLLIWWLEEERDGTVRKLRQCASVTLLHAQNAKREESDGAHVLHPHSHEASNGDRKQLLYPPISELFIALLHAARRKSNAFNDQRCRQLYTAEVIAPMCSEYLDMIHAEAAWLRKQLLARRARCVLPPDNTLTWNVMEWSSLITGTNLVAQAVCSRLHPLKGENAKGQLSHEYGPRDESRLDQVGESMKRLCTAMTDEFTAAFIETIVMERAKLASYMMRAPFILSEPHLPTTLNDHDPSMTRKQCLKVDGIHEMPSPDLTNSIHVVSVCVMACNVTALKLHKMSLTDNGPSNLLHFGSHSILEAVKFAMGQKLLDIAIDPQGMTPEISLGGAIQFRRDVMSFSSLFDNGGCGIVSADKGSEKHNDTNEPGPMDRAETASRLMSLESSRIRTLREALQALLQNNESGSLFGRGRGTNSSDCFESDQRLIIDDFCNDALLLDEATSMIEANGFGALSLDEALSLINRRL